MAHFRSVAVGGNRLAICAEGSLPAGLQCSRLQGWLHSHWSAADIHIYYFIAFFFFFNRDFREPPLSIKDNRQNGKLADEIRLQQVAVELLKQPPKLLSGRFSGSPTCEVLRKVQC